MKTAYFSFREYNIADWISFYRIVVTPVIFYFIFRDEKFTFAILLAISFFSDTLDGILARRMKILSERGTLLDSLGDAVLIFTSLFGAFWFEKTLFIGNKWPILFIAFLYIFLSILLYIKYRRPSSFHTYLAKVTFIILAIFFLYLFFFGFNQFLFNLVIIIAAVEIIEEICIAFLLPKHKTNVKGLYWILKNREFYLK